MEKLFSGIGGLIIVVFALLVISPGVYADDAGQAKDQAQAQAIPSVEQLEAQFEHQLTTRDEKYGQPRASCYYGALEDHYAQDQLRSDEIGEGIR